MLLPAHEGSFYSPRSPFSILLRSSMLLDLLALVKSEAGLSGCLK